VIFVKPFFKEVVKLINIKTKRIMKPIKIEFSAKLPFRIKKSGKYYISDCPILDVYSQGNTEEEAKVNLIDALSLFFISCYERGTLDSVLKECGFEATKPSKKKRKIDFNYIDVPIPFSVNKNEPIECPA
jgi:predicted RNase H-like HicB family nuclease